MGEEGGGATLSDRLVEMTDETENILKAKARMEALNLGPFEGLWDAITEGFFHHIRPDVLSAIMFFSVVSVPPAAQPRARAERTLTVALPARRAASSSAAFTRSRSEPSTT